MKPENEIQVADLTKYCELTKTSLSFRKDVSEDEWLDVFNSLKNVEGCVQFWIGDCLAYRSRKWGMYEDIAEKTGYDKETLSNYKTISESVEMPLRNGDLTFNHHVAVASLPAADQARVLKKASEEKLTVRETREEVKAVKRHDENRSAPYLPNKKYQIIYADPPWKYDNTQEFYGQDVERHYPTMSPEELFALDIKNLADKDCVLYMWTTAPKLNIGLKVLEAWGFNYKSCVVWDKVKHNMGFYSSVRHEILLIGGKGQSAPTDKKYANQTDSVYVEERTEHSKKPEYYYEMIEKMHPLKIKRLELFARASRKGWESWGNE